MAKVSTLTAATAVAAADTIYLVQGGASKRATLSVPWTFGGDVTFNQAVNITGNIVHAGAFTNPLKAPDGSAAAPAYSFSSATSLGWYRDSSGAGLVASGSGTAFFRLSASADFVVLANDASLVFSRTGITAGDTFLKSDAANTLAQRNGSGINQTFRLYRSFVSSSDYDRLTLRALDSGMAIATEGAGTQNSTANLLLVPQGGTVEQRNGVNSQIFRIYNTFTNGSNYERFSLEWGSGVVSVYTSAAGTGSPREIWLYTSGSAALHLGTNGVLRWSVNTSGHFVSFADNTYDIGASGATRPRTGYFGTSVETPLIRNGAAGVVTLQPSGANPGELAIGHGSQSTRLRLIKDSGIAYIYASDAVPLAFGTANTQQFSVAHTASAVNYLQATGAATGSGPVLSAQGSDTNASLRIVAKGSGSVRLETGGGTLQAAATHVASAVNYVQIQGGATGSPGNVAIAAQGSDTNVQLSLDGKGTGALRLNQNTGADIQWGRALIALGGGAAPTFGTIGGGGPATAAQNSWMRVLDSAGAAFWVPAWK